MDPVDSYRAQCDARLKEFRHTERRKIIEPYVAEYQRWQLIITERDLNDTELWLLSECVDAIHAYRNRAPSSAA